ncbi:MAG: hypothetical protein ACOC35_09655 [Promethearchaeia archaeon]
MYKRKERLSELEKYFGNLKKKGKEKELLYSSENLKIGQSKRYGKYIHIDGLRLAIDHWNPEADIIFITHAHMDHIPVIPDEVQKKIRNGSCDIKFLCSKITKEVAEARTRGKFHIPDNLWLLSEQHVKYRQAQHIFTIKNVTLKLLNSGHTYGANGLFIKGSESIYYTGDFIAQDRIFSWTSNEKKIMKGLKPLNCDHLIMECTFGAPRFQFPDLNTIKKQTRHFIDSNLKAGKPTILLAYTFGKGQHLLQLLEGFKRVLLHRNMANLVEILETNGIDFPNWEPYGNYNKNKLQKLNDYILLVPPYAMFKEPYKTLIANGARTAIFSGKVLQKRFQEKFLADEYFKFSDHCDFQQLFNFVQKCQAENIYLDHGKKNEFSEGLVKNNPLKKVKIF